MASWKMGRNSETFSGKHGCYNGIILFKLKCCHTDQFYPIDIILQCIMCCSLSLSSTQVTAIDMVIAFVSQKLNGKTPFFLKFMAFLFCYFCYGFSTKDDL